MRQTKLKFVSSTCYRVAKPVPGMEEDTELRLRQHQRPLEPGLIYRWFGLGNDWQSGYRLELHRETNGLKRKITGKTTKMVENLGWFMRKNGAVEYANERFGLNVDPTARAGYVHPEGTHTTE